MKFEKGLKINRVDYRESDSIIIFENSKTISLKNNADCLIISGDETDKVHSLILTSPYLMRPNDVL